MSEYIYLAHEGVKGMKWYHRLYQNKDGSLTPLGRVHYGVGEARKKAVSAVKNAPKAAKEAIKTAPKKAVASAKNTAKTLRTARTEHNKVRRENKAKRQAERDEKHRLERERKIAVMQRRLIRQNQKKTIRELEQELGNARVEKARKRVEALLERQQRAKDLADLKEQERYLKKTMKQTERQARKDARSRYSRNTIKDLTDKELDLRIERLKKEATLRGLEAERAVPSAVSNGAKTVGKWTSDLANAAVSGLAGTVKVAVGAKAIPYIKEMGVTQKDIDEFIKWTKKK